MVKQGTYIEHIGGPYDGKTTEWLKIPPPRIQRKHQGRDYTYVLHEVDGDLVYFFEGFHGQTINPTSVEDEA